ncbi:DUF6282 family protein [Compostimonas suwonensis]|uniref:Phosphotriesterase-related protein n=1 Tax=Compostimonas suwonensis TaxID=1048394 RepID=A0A2M9BCH7_9MICO|nr:DUF6282 family protein [Compostimonas suwonensis]PJJ55604.1 hypothetical protein CLV54_2951 [Compostimonas suwonensis]
MFAEDRILEGALDLHAHGSPEYTLARRPRVDNDEWARLAIAAGMRGFVVKSHVWPTTGVVEMLKARRPQLEIFSSITLNPPVGGFDPVAVEIAAQMGARVVWMPTWSARHDPVTHSITLDRMKAVISTLDVERALHEDSLTILDEEGRLLPSVGRVLEVCARYGMTVASGHLPIASSLVLAQACAEAGVRFVLTHANSASVGASFDQQRAIARTGGFIEHVIVSCMPMHGRGDPRAIADSIREVGAEHCVMASDAGEAWNPPAPELLRMFIGSMLALGIPDDAVHLMTHDNPARALGLTTDWTRYE